MTNKKATLSAFHVERLNAVNRRYNEEVFAKLPQYPDPQTDADKIREMLSLGIDALTPLGWKSHNLLTPEDLEGLKGLESLKELGGLKGLEGLEGLERLRYHGDQRRKQQKQRQSGKGKGRGKGGAAGETLVDPRLVLSVVQRMIEESGLKPVGMGGPVIRAVQNFENLTDAKANWFIETYAQIIPLAHIWKCAEVTPDGLARIAKKTGYTASCPKDTNSRGMTVGLLVHPRFKVLDEWTIWDVANVQGVHDLRPVHGVDLEDTGPDVPEAQRKSWEAAEHGKSMRGGEATTSVIRLQQNTITGKYLKNKGRGGIGGDWNTKIGTPAGDKDTAPLIEAGLVLVGKDDTRSTQSMGSRLDAEFSKDFAVELHIEHLFAWFEDAEIHRGLTDHGALIIA